jgi:hypothetical protein
MKKYIIQGETVQISQSTRKNKEYVAKFPDGDRIHFADPTMNEFPGTKRGDSYCARSFGIKGKDDVRSPNFWSRQLWSCQGKKSISSRRFFGKLK